MITGRVDQLKVTEDGTPYLYKLLSEEYKKLRSVYFQIKRSPFNNDLYKYEDVYFVVDGFEGAPLQNQLTSKMEVFLAVKRQAGLEIHRSLKFNMSPISLFYSSIGYETGLRKKELGVFCSCRDLLIEQLSKIKDRLILKFYPKDKITFELVDDMEIADDFGEAVTEFPENYQLARKKLPDQLLSARYSIAGANHYSTLPVKDGTLCVLVAETDNLYDDHAIRILRWVPVLKSEVGNTYVHPLYKMAFISRSDNHDLHEGMIKTGNFLLFGKVVDGRISILGNKKALDSEPLCDYALPFSLFNLL